jgi:hypothetical protein
LDGIRILLHFTNDNYDQSYSLFNSVLVLITFQMQSQELVDEDSFVKNNTKGHFKKRGHKVQILKTTVGNKKVLSKSFNK